MAKHSAPRRDAQHDVYGYTRVSMEEQAGILRLGGRSRSETDKGAGLTLQEERIRAYCKLYDFNLVEMLSDPGYSGKSLARPALQRGLEGLKMGTASGLVVYKLDRLTRSIRDLSSLTEEYFGEKTKVGAGLYSYQEKLDTSTATGRFFLGMIVQVSQWERETIGERTRESLGSMRAAGLRTGSVPYGWDLDADDTRRSKRSDGKLPSALKPNVLEQSIIQNMQKLRSEDWTYDRIAWALNHWKIPTKTQRGPWSKRVVYDILKRAESTPCDAASIPLHLEPLHEVPSAG